jgi:hypothetical protein
MKERINEDVLCVLRENKSINQIEIDYVDITNPLKLIIDNFSILCENSETTIQQLVTFIENTKEFEQLTAHYRYCISLRGSYQAFSANNQETIKEINKDYQLILHDNEKHPNTKNLIEKTNDLKQKIKCKYILWCKAFSINKAYRRCYEDKSILTFSHRIDGWSNPLYQLTPNFSVEIKTNFGYGGASYFYTKLKYKNIEITPFSEWIDYEFAHFSEILRYTRSYSLSNEYWIEAMEFSRDACNLSLTDEVKFIGKYIINECNKMVVGLEEIFNKEQFTFKKRGQEDYSINKNEHAIIEFRGEKISGSLDFVSKILELEAITSVEFFIKKIEEINQRIQPILIEEIPILNIKIKNIEQEKNKLKPKYDEINKVNNDYKQKKIKFKKEMISKSPPEKKWIDQGELEINFIEANPEYSDFKNEYRIFTDAYQMLIQRIKNNIKIRDKIIHCNQKITQYFSNKKTNTPPTNNL